MIGLQKCGEDWKYKYKFTEETQYIKDAEDEEQDIIYFNHEYREHGAENFTAEEARKVCFSVLPITEDGTIPTYYDEALEQTKEFEGITFEIYMARIDGKWYLTDYWKYYIYV